MDFYLPKIKIKAKRKAKTKAKKKANRKVCGALETGADYGHPGHPAFGFSYLNNRCEVKNAGLVSGYVPWRATHGVSDAKGGLNRDSYPLIPIVSGLVKANFLSRDTPCEREGRRPESRF